MIQDETPLTSAQIEGQVMACFSEMMVEEDIQYTQEALAAVEKLAKFFCYPRVLDICKRYLMKMQNAMTTSEIEEEQARPFRSSINLCGFDYPGNTLSRKMRMKNLSEEDVIAMFRHLCLVAFKKH
ncbi:unnamed protein product [Caenorhabditis sp. 36 PRJEB53466]|nr:unnamed protein product [Caenorhabditis sp. 36 PRJEB53466]